MYNFYLTEEDEIRNGHFPVIAVFNMGCNYSILDFFTGLCRCTGWNGDFGGCCFWDELDEYDKAHTEKFDGVLFELDNDENVVISFNELFHYMKIAAERYAKENNSFAEELNKILKQFENKYSIQEDSGNEYCDNV
ncbi:MAG: ribonuclease toxin immunity protein CdiI [Ruminococcus sp.]|nr:ribonuclease toxin immunity protein CdiI [Ruminococcus sp.]